MTEAPVTEDLAALVVQAKAFAITTPTDYRTVAEFALAMKELRAKVARTFDEHIARAFQAHRALCKEKHDAEAQMVEAEEIAKALMLAWDDAQRIADDAARVAQDEITRAAVIQLETDATIAERSGDYQRADEIREQVSQFVPPAIVPPSRPKVDGVVFRETWSARVLDFGALVRAAAQHPAWIALLKPDMPALNAQARSLRARMAIPGVRAVSSRGVATSAPAPRERVDD